jgi:tRNA (uracil-5-)-methyltransferase
MFETGDPSAPHVPASSVPLDVGLFGGKTAKETRRWRRTPHEVVHYPMGSTRLCELMPRLLEALNEVAELRARVDYASFLTTLSGDALVALTYNRRIDTDEWRAAATALAARLGAGVKLIGRSKNVKVVLGGDGGGGGGGGGGDGGDGGSGDGGCDGSVVIDDTVTERLNIPERGLCVYKQLEGAFSQPNARVCEKMLGWAYEVTRGSESKDLCELYCGNGCFTVALAPNFRRVLAT